MIQPSKGKAKSYDDNFLDHVASSDLYKNWSSNKSNIKLATTNSFDTEKHRIDFDSSNQDELKGDVNPFLNQFVNLQSEDPYNELRAYNQSGTEQVGKIIPRAGVKAATEVAKLAPIIYGVGKAIFEDNKTSTLEDIFNNEGIKALDEMNQTINTELLPVYVKDSVKNGNLMDNLMSTSFYATEGADGLGFMASMFAPGMILSKFALGSKLIGGLSKASKLTKMVEGTEGSVHVLKGLGWTGRAIDSKIAVLANSFIEAGAESKGTQDSLNGERINEIESYKSQGLSQEQAEQVFNDKHPDWNTNVAEAMKGDFWTQLPMLIGTGSMMQKAIFGKTLDKVEKTVEQGLKGRAGSVVKQWGKALLSEGFVEEASQSTLENYYTKKALSGKLKDGWSSALEIGGLTEEYINTVNSTEGAKAIFLGALMGGPAMSMEARREYKKGLKDTNTITNGVNSSIDEYNTIRENDIYEKDPNDPTKSLFKRDSNNNLTSEKVLNRKKALDVALSLKNTEEDDKIYEDALKSDDVELQKFIQNRNILKLIAPAIQNGELGLKILKDQLEESSKFTDIAESDKTNKDEATSNKNLVKQILEKAKHLQEQNEKFKDFAPDIIKLDDPRGTKEVNENYLNHLNSKYIEVKALQYDAENKLDNLNKKKENILNELNINPELSSQNILDNGRLLQDYKNKSPLLVKVLNEINKTNSEISKHKEDINDFWDNKSNIINDAFSSHLDGLDIKTKDTSEENVQKTDEFISEINEINGLEDLDKFTRTNKEYLKDNPIINEFIKSKVEERKEVIKQAKLEELRIQSELEHEQNLEEEEVNPTDGSPKNVVTKGSPLDLGTESLQSSDTLELNEVSPKEFEETVDSKENKGARLISTDQRTGKVLIDKTTGEPNKQLQAFHKYEQDPRNKKDDIVTFSIGDFKFVPDGKNLEKVFNRLVNGEKLSVTEIQSLEDYLPIKTTLTDNKNRDNSASSFLDSMSHPEKEIVEKETLPLRKSIIQSLIKNKGSFEGINGKVKDQFPGILKIEDESNNVLALQFLKLQKDPLTYFRDNTGYVNYEGKYCKSLTGKQTNDAPLFKKGNSTKHKGELFLKIEQNNGSPFFLKLNTNKISENKANALFDLMTIKFITESEDISLMSLKSYISQNPEYSAILDELGREIEFIEGNSNKTMNETVNRLIDMLIYNGNQNSHTKFGLYFNNATVVGNKGELYIGETGIHVGSLFNKLHDENMSRQSISSDEFKNDIEGFRKGFVDFFQYKRHNVLFKSGNGFTFQNKDYLQYLTDEVLSTNANVEQTFQGYSNIYLESSVSLKGESFNSNNSVEVKNVITPSIDKPSSIAITTEEELLNAIDYGNEYVADLETVIELPPNDNTLSGLIKAFDKLKTSNIKEYNKRLILIIKTLPNTGIEALKNGHIFVLTEAVNEGIPVEGVKVKKDC